MNEKEFEIQIEEAINAFGELVTDIFDEYGFDAPEISISIDPIPVDEEPERPFETMDEFHKELLVVCEEAEESLSQSAGELYHRLIGLIERCDPNVPIDLAELLIKQQMGQVYAKLNRGPEE